MSTLRNLWIVYRYVLRACNALWKLGTPVDVDEHDGNSAVDGSELKSSVGWWQERWICAVRTDRLTTSFANELKLEWGRKKLVTICNGPHTNPVVGVGVLHVVVVDRDGCGDACNGGDVSFESWRTTLESSSTTSTGRKRRERRLVSTKAIECAKIVSRVAFGVGGGRGCQEGEGEEDVDQHR